MHLKKLVTAMIIGSFMLVTVPTNLVLADNETAVVETAKEEIVPISQEENKNEETANNEEAKSDNQTLENTEEKSENEKEVQLEDKKVEKENKTEHKKIENKKENKVEEKKKNNNQNNNKKKDTVNSKKNGKNTKYAFTLDSVNMRSQANTKSKVLVTLKKNTKLTILKKENGWLKVQYGKKVGYVSAKYVKVTSTSKPVENQKPVTNNNSNSTNKKPNANTTKGMDFLAFDKWTRSMGVDEFGGYRDQGIPVGLCWAKKDVAYIGSDSNAHISGHFKNWTSLMKNSLSLLLPTKDEDVWKIVSKKNVKAQTLYLDGRKVVIYTNEEWLFIKIYNQ